MGSTGNLRAETFMATGGRESQDNHNSNSVEIIINHHDDDEDNNNNHNNNDQNVSKTETSSTDKQQEPALIQLSDFVGEHGAYQLSLTLLLFVRYIFLGLMANSGSLMTPDVTFYCQLPMAEVLDIMPNISLLNRQEQELEIKEEFKRTCQIDLHLYHNQSNFSPKSFKSPAPSLIEPPKSLLATTNNNLTSTATAAAPARIRECTEFSYELATDQGRTMTSEFDLVCERDWLRSLFQSLVSGAMTVAHVFWGTFSDKYGRYEAQRLCCFVSLLAGGLSMVAADFWTFTLARALCSFADLGLVVSMTTVVVELVGSRLRGLSVALVNFGNALGVALLPYVVAYFEDFRLVVGFTLLCHILTMPLVLATNESVRWLLSNRRFKRARRELKRIARFNKVRLRLDQLGEQVASEGLNDITDAPTRKTKSAEHKKAFERLFEQFIKQIESQNLIDPYYFDQPSSTTASRVSKTNDIPEIRRSATPPTSPSPPPADTPTAAIPAAAEINPAPPPASKTHLQPALSSNGFLQVPDRQTLRRQAKTSATKSNDILESDKRPNGSPQSMRSNKGRPPAGRRKSSATGRPIVRASSCSRIDKESLLRHQQTILQPSLAAQMGSPNGSFKRLTLPAVNSQAASVCSDEDDDDYEDSSDDDDDDLSQLRALHRPGAVKQQPDCINMVAHQLSFMGRVNRLFKDKRLMIAVFTIVWTTFNSELQYNSFIIINLEVGEDVYLNYILGACMEALAAISACLLLSYATRRRSLITFWLLISLSCFGLSIAHIDSTWAVWCLALAKFSQSCLSSIASVAAYEAFPTFLRQSGSGLVFTLGNLGSVFAPLIFQEFDDHAGMDRVLMTFSGSSLTAAILIYLYLNETRDCELQ